LGNYPKALGLFEKAVDLKENDEAISWSILLKLYEKIGEVEKAKKIRERYIK